VRKTDRIRENVKQFNEVLRFEKTRIIKDLEKTDQLRRRGVGGVESYYKLGPGFNLALKS